MEVVAKRKELSKKCKYISKLDVIKIEVKIKIKMKMKIKIE